MATAVGGMNAYFNSQPHKEADKAKVGVFSIALDFNSQPHKEADRSTPSAR